MPKGAQEARVMRITPKTAEKWLENNDHNRNLRQRLIERYARSMRMGLWELNGETIVIGSDGSVLDGQHRLWAIFESGVSVECWVVMGVDPSTFKTIDIGLNRTGADHAGVAKIKNAKIVSGAVQYVFRYVNGYPVSGGGYGCTPTEMIELYHAHPELDDSVAYGRASNKFVTNTAGAALHYMFAHVDREKANKFFDALASGEFDVGMSPVRALRERLITAAMRKERRDSLDILTKMAMVIKAWEAFNRKKDIRVIRYCIGEKFPKIRSLPKQLMIDFADKDPARANWKAPSKSKKGKK